MNKENKKANRYTRQDVRYAQLSELSMVYEGSTEEITLRPPDLSPHGMFINTKLEYAEGSVIRLRFRLSRTGVLVQVRCEVRYLLKGVGIGVSFLDVSPYLTQAIEDEISLHVAGK